jgi:hypothetical protein
VLWRRTRLFFVQHDACTLLIPYFYYSDIHRILELTQVHTREPSKIVYEKVSPIRNRKNETVHVRAEAKEGLSLTTTTGILEGERKRLREVGNETEKYERRIGVCTNTNNIASSRAGFLYTTRSLRPVQ